MKVGDRVKVIILEFADKRDTDLRINDTGIIVELNIQGTSVHKVRFDRPIACTACNYDSATGAYGMFEWQLEVVKNECIVIYRKDREVIALDKRTGNKAVAKCHEDDTFDFDTGAKLAFERLTGVIPFEPKAEFSVGDKVVIKSWEQLKKEFGVKKHFGGEHIPCKYAFAERMKHYCGEIATITGIHGVKIYLDFENHCNSADYVFSTDMVVKLDKRYYTGKVVCTDNSHNVNAYTEGKTYQFINGKMINDKRDVVPYSPVKTFEEWERWTASKFIEADKAIFAGDKVKIVNSDRVYDLYDNWSGLKGWESHFVRGKNPTSSKSYMVLKVRPHDRVPNAQLALIQDKDTTQVFIVDVEGLNVIR